MKKVIYISNGHLSEKLMRDWYIYHLQANGIIVEFWDLVTLLFGEIVEANSIHRDFIFTPKVYCEIEKKLCLPENKDAAYIMLVNWEGRCSRLYRLLSKYNCRMYFIACGAFPFKSMPKWLKIIHGFSHPLRLMLTMYNKAKGIVCKKMKLVKPFDVVFGAGYAILGTFPDAGKVVPTNLPDYDQYMKVKSKTADLVSGRYCVFLDIYLPFHPDLKIVGFESIDAGRYFASLNRFFGILEKKTGMKVVIAAHPHADYVGETFQSRTICRGRTEELVRDAEIVISHHSASTSYAILNKKPIIFIYTNEMKNKYKYTVVSCIQDFAAYLDAPIYNIDELVQGDQINIRAINKGSYNRYKYEFLTTRESEHTTAQEIFWREIIHG